MKSRESRILLAIVLTAVFVRLFYLWIGRPEFVGWFNHTYYYFVQVRSLLETGSLAFDDMPLLFYLYALGAKILQFAGMNSESAIVNSTRFFMCVIPSLIPVPIYLFVKHSNGGGAPERNQWILIGAAAILPLSLTHLPELLQKNTLGLFLLACIILLVYRLLTSFGRNGGPNMGDTCH